MKRRTFIEIAASGAAALALPGSVEAGQAMHATLSRPRLLDVLHDPQAVRALGEKYRDVVPAERDAAALTQAMVGTAWPTTPGALRLQMDAQVQRDFEAGQTITLDGWILSVTEARQCALYSLQA